MIVPLQTGGQGRPPLQKMKNVGNDRSLSRTEIRDVVPLERSFFSVNSFSPITLRIPEYIILAKPGIAGTVLLTTLTGFLLAAPAVNWSVLVHTLFATALVAFGAGALNMLLESDTDARMSRTKNRPLPAGKILPQEAFFLGVLSASVGIVHLAAMVNLAACFIAAMSLFFYLALYTPLKKDSFFCTVIGSISGALPPFLGWSAAKGSLTLEAFPLFLILFIWQFPHLLALAWMYQEDYARVGFKMLPANDSSGRNTSKLVLISSLILLPSSGLPYWLGLTGIGYFLASIILSLWLLASSWSFFLYRDLVSARRLFLTSIAYIPSLFLSMIIA